MLGTITNICEPKTLARAIIRTYGNTENPGSDHCITNKVMCAKLIARIITEWSVHAKTEEWEFPFSESLVLGCWIKWRKMSAENRHLTRVTLEM